MKLCQRTPVGSLYIRRYAVTLTASFSTIGRPLLSHCGAKSRRTSANRVKPQSLSSALKRWFAAGGTIHISMTPIGFLLCSLTVHYVYRRVMLVPHNQAELDTSVPTLRRLLISIFVALFEIEGREVDVVSKRK